MGVTDREARRSDELRVPHYLGEAQRSSTRRQDLIKLASHLMHDAPACEQPRQPLIALLCQRVHLCIQKGTCRPLHASGQRFGPSLVPEEFDFELLRNDRIGTQHLKTDRTQPNGYGRLARLPGSVSRLRQRCS